MERLCRKNGSKRQWFAKYVRLHPDEFVVMPNHVHGILIINHPVVGAIHESPLHSIRQYIAENPLRWHLDRENPSRIALDDEFPL